MIIRPTALLAGLSVAVTLLVAPGAAYAADTTTDLTATEMAAALKTVGAASAKAAAQGWNSRSVSTGDEGTDVETTAYDPARKVYATHRGDAGTTGTDWVVVSGRGSYSSLTEPVDRSAMAMIGRPKVRWVLQGDTKADAAGTSRQDPLAPWGVNEPVFSRNAGTKVTHDDGSAEYAAAGRSTGFDVTWRVNAAGVLTATTLTFEDQTLNLSFGYGEQKLTAPAAAVSVDYATYRKALVYLDMPADVKNAAVQGASAARKAAKGGKVKVATVRNRVREQAWESNYKSGVKVVKVKNVTGGAKVWATNPWTKKTVAYTVKASGRKVTVRKV
ncbi:hypothetical protein [Actinoplanes sp. NBRC 101535]|uniref:hypothetical protein n=1 Tax=Actinoplanes sp. NBRC 101535 TaxID=3032196 RepID=UPI0024A48F46|nr:hypothetical protein [Actinoplanes sp. NBRC 101535]GLY00534.1 hypothetical protein Acsp01_09130 [Actinoplanes sp. NBRC 101535]